MTRAVKYAAAVSIVVLVLALLSGCGRGEATTSAVKTEPPAESAPTPTDRQDEAAAVAPEPAPRAEAAAAGEKEPVEPGQAVDLTLKFAAGQVAVYRAASDAQKSIEWKGAPAAKPAQFIDGRSGNRVEMTFEQRVQQVREDGSAILEITIKALKYAGEIRGNVVFAFDSTKEEDIVSPLTALIGKGYRLEMSAKGQVLAVIDAGPVRQVVPEGSAAYNVAVRLLSNEEIKSRHEVPALVALEDSRVRPGRTWSDLKTFSFGEMGPKSYERVYTLAQVQPEDGGRAVIEMEAIPSAAVAEEVHRQQAAGPLARMFDNVESYEGRIELDLGDGQVAGYTEQMETVWTFADPAGAPDGGPPPAFTMAARQMHTLERIE